MSADVLNLGGQFGYETLTLHSSHVLGAGAYGRVVRANLDNLQCAAKILQSIFFQDNDPGAARFAAQFDQECALLRELKHPCIVQFLGMVIDPINRRPILLMELMEESLTKFLERGETPLPYHIQVDITLSIALALAYLHGKNIVHRDLSSNNILLSGEGSLVKVTDFGVSHIMDGMTRSKITLCPGTPPFMPPEALRLTKPKCLPMIDIFSLGVVIVQIITRLYPAPTDAQVALPDETSPTGEKILPVAELERRKEDLEKVSPDHCLLPTALHCIRDKPHERPTAPQLCQSLEQIKRTETYTVSETKHSHWQQFYSPEGVDRVVKEGEEGCSLVPQLSHMAIQGRDLTSSQEERDLYDAALRGDVSNVRTKLAGNVNVNCTPYKDGVTPLYRASQNGHTDVVNILLSGGASVNLANNMGMTALCIASQKGHNEVVSTLLKNEAGVNVALKSGATPLIIASQNGHEVVVTTLLKSGAGVNVAAEDGGSPLYIASERGHRNVVITLLRSGACVNTTENGGATPLLIASEKGHLGVAALLLKCGARINMAKKTGSTPLFMACQNGHREVVNMLLANGADADIRGYKNFKPVDIAIVKGHKDIVYFLRRKR